jgi:EmrB/QacA subfamily drug resistance transporter
MWAIARTPSDENLIRAGPATTPCQKSRGRWVLAATILATSMAFIDSTVVNVALPALQTHLGASALDVQWVVEAYSLLLSALLLIGGSLGDHYGRRRVFVIGVAIFAIASAACGLAIDVRQLIAARALQGLGAALLVPGSLAIISNTFPEKERGRAIGTWSGVSAITTGIGPVLGGWAIEHLSWRAAFFINVPIALIIIPIALRHIPENADEEPGPIDWLGAILAALGLGFLVYGLIESSSVGLKDRSVIIVLAVAAVFLVAFLIREARTKNPMLPLSLFRERTFAGANVLTFLLYAALGGAMFFLPLNLIQVQSYSATAAGAALLPFIVVISLMSRWSGGLVTRYGSKLPLIVGPLIAACGFALFIPVGIDQSYWTSFFPAIFLLGIGMGVSVAPLTTTVMNSVGQHRAGIASGVNNAIARSAGLIAIAVLGIVMLQVFTGQFFQRTAQWNLAPRVAQSLMDQRTRLAAIVIPSDYDPVMTRQIRRGIDESFVAGFRAVMALGAIFAAASALTSLLFIGSFNTQKLPDTQTR